MPVIRAWKDVLAMRPTQVERRLIRACKNGEVCALYEGRTPKGDPNNRLSIRAELLRYLILGGCERCLVHEWGVRLVGAHIIGRLELSFGTARGATSLKYCRVSHPIDALHARFITLDLDGSRLNGLNAQGVEVKGGLFLRRVISTAELTLAGATIGGQLNLSSARLFVSDGDAINAHSMHVSEIFTMSGLRSNGEVTISGSKVEGQLNFEGSRLFPKGDYALTAQKLHVEGGLFWRNGTHAVDGIVDFTASYVADLVDDPDCWPEQEHLKLNGLTYNRIGSADLDVKRRITWLEKGADIDGKFRPQPFTQLAIAMREAGHESDARHILFEREDRLRKYIRRKRHENASNDPRNYVAWLLYDLATIFLFVRDFLWRWVTGYGYRVQNSLYALLVLWMLASWLSYVTWETGDMAPNSGPILVTEEWQAIATSDDANPAKLWAERPRRDDNTPIGTAPGQDWTTFSSFAYAADLVIPIIDLGQTDAWAPSTERGKWGKRLWRYGFLLQIAGWIVTALAAAAITGIIRRD